MRGVIRLIKVFFCFCQPAPAICSLKVLYSLFGFVGTEVGFKNSSLNRWDLTSVNEGGKQREYSWVRWMQGVRSIRVRYIRVLLCNVQYNTKWLMFQSTQTSVTVTEKAQLRKHRVENNRLMLLYCSSYNRHKTCTCTGTTRLENNALIVLQYEKRIK